MAADHGAGLGAGGHGAGGEGGGVGAAIGGAAAAVDAEWRSAAAAWTRSVRELIREVCSEVVQSVTRELETAVAKAMARAGGGGKGGKAAAAADEDADDDTDTDADSEGGGEGGGSRAERLARSKAEKEALVAKLESWTSSGDADGWLAALQLVEGLPQAQRAERRLLPGYTSRVYKRLVRAIPGSLTRIGAGVGVHYALKPRWAEIVKAGRTARRVALRIFKKRFYTPFRGILLDLLNRQPKLTTKAALEDSTASLTSMLTDFLEEQDWAVRPADRAAEIAAVSRAYESEIKRGALKGLIRGKLLRLLLIQMQVVKTQLLKAMGAIDDLVDANRLNMQILASVPAVVLFGVGWRFLHTLFWLLRTRSGRSMRQVHAQMGRSLEQLERCLVLAGSPRPQAAAELAPRPPANDDGARGDEGGGRRERTAGRRGGSSGSGAKAEEGVGGGGGGAEGQASTTTTREGAEDEDLDGVRDLDPQRALRGAELGEFVLHVHSYLLLLDFASPVYATREADTIHHEMQDLLRQGELSLGQQAALLRSIKGRHSELGKVLM